MMNNIGNGLIVLGVSISAFQSELLPSMILDFVVIFGGGLISTLRKYLDGQIKGQMELAWAMMAAIFIGYIGGNAIAAFYGLENPERLSVLGIMAFIGQVIATFLSDRDRWKNVFWEVMDFIVRKFKK